MTFNAELLGVGRGNAPVSALEPPPKYPPRPNRPRELPEGPEFDYLLAVRKEFVQHMRHSAFFVRGAGCADSANLNRYSDRYENIKEVKF